MSNSSPVYPRVFEDPVFVDRCAELVQSYERLLQKPLIRGFSRSRHESPYDLFDAPGVIVAHETQTDPIFWFGNRQALELFELEWQDFVNMPSRKSAEMPEREERERLLNAVRTHGYLEDYSGVRVSSTGRRFRIEAAVVWNVYDSYDQYIGQAATFDNWIHLES